MQKSILKLISVVLLVHLKAKIYASFQSAVIQVELEVNYSVV